MRIANSVAAPLLGSLLTISYATSVAQPKPPPEARPAATLVRFVQASASANPRVRAALAALRASGARQDAASRPLYNPQLSIGAENATSQTRTLGLSQQLDWTDKRKTRKSVAQANQLAAEARYQAVRRAVTVELLQGLARYQTAAAQARLLRTRVGLMRDFADLVQRRFDAGDLNQVTLDLAHLALTQARMQRATADAAFAEARQMMRGLAPQSNPAMWPVLPGSPPGLQPGMDAATRVLALPEVIATRRQVEAAIATVGLRRKEQRPDPTLDLTGGAEDGESLVGLTLSIPLFVRNGFSDEVTAAVADRTRAQAIADDVMQRAHARLVGASERYRLSFAAWADWYRHGQTSLTRQTDQIRQLWEAGDLSTTDYLVQLRQTLDVRASALALKETLWQAWFEWLSASGEVDAWLDAGMAR